MLIAAVSTKALWYLTRGTGLVTLLLLTLSLVLGIVETVRWASPRWPRFVTAGLHKNVSLLVIVLLTIHIVTAVADGFAPIRWLDTVVPFTSAYRPLWLGLGALGLDLLLALTITSLLRQRIGYRAWRAVHWAAYACWPVSIVHGLGTGSDTKLGWVLLLNAACVVAVIAALCWRLASGWPAQTRIRTAAAVATAAAPLALVAWLVAGPLRPGWARAAGTPTALIANSQAPASGSGTTPGSGTAASPGAAGQLQPPFTATLSGTLSQSGPDGNGQSTVTINATLSNGATGALHVVLQGPASSDGGIQMQTSSATLGPTAQPTLYQGQITSLRGTSLALAMHDSAGNAVSVALRLQIDQSNNVAGTVQASQASAG